MLNVTQADASTDKVDVSKYIPSISELYVEQRTELQKKTDRSKSVLREIYYACRNLQGRIVDYYNPNFDLIKNGKLWRAESEGLYVLVHGLNGHPAIWKSHIAQLKKDSNKDLFVPYVPLKGNGPLDDVSNPILEVIKDYTMKHPKKPICLIGVSNGGRICTWLETRLRACAPSTPVRISTIAAVHFGTKRMNLVQKFHQWTGRSLGYCHTIVNDLSFGSKKAREILDEVSKPLPKGTIRDYEFFASTEDLQVPGLVSSIPKVGNNSTPIKRIVHGYDHNGIVAGVCDEQVKSCKMWMEKQFNKKTVPLIVP